MACGDFVESGGVNQSGRIRFRHRPFLLPCDDLTQLRFRMIVFRAGGLNPRGPKFFSRTLRRDIATLRHQPNRERCLKM